MAGGRPNGERSHFLWLTGSHTSSLTFPIILKVGTDTTFYGSGNCGSRRPSDLLKVTQTESGKTEVQTHRHSVFEFGPVERRARATPYIPELCNPGCRGFWFSPVRISSEFVLFGFCAHEVPFCLHFLVSHRLLDRTTINVFNVLRFSSVFLVVNL